MNTERIKENIASQRIKMLDAYSKKEEAKLITKAELDEEYPVAGYERYSLLSIDNFRKELTKAEGVSDPDKAFIEATKDLKSFVVTDKGNKAIVFVRKKESGE